MKRILVPLLVTLLLTGCAVRDTTGTRIDEQSPTKPEPVKPAPGVLVIARDFVNALEQLAEAPPGNTTVHLASDQTDDAFTLAMNDALVNAGYAIRWVQDGQRNHYLQYRKELEASDRLSRREVYELAIGNIEMRRTYSTDLQGAVKPLTPLYVRGADATGIVLNDSIFGEQPSTADATKIPVTDDAVDEPVPAASDLSTFPTDTQAAAQTTQTEITQTELSNSTSLLVPAEASPLDPLVAGTAAQTLSMPLVTLPKVENVFELGGSNFEDVLARYEVVGEQVLMFPNDSLRLGFTNKQLIQKMVKEFDSDSDVFSVVGCSMGPTNVSGGNAALALGRASRVVEALLFAGVEKDKILDEGCWASGNGLEELPKRGVVLTLNRDMS
jgi:hypothetical protein